MCNQFILHIEYVMFNQGGSNKKAMQLNLSNLFSILIINELYLFT